MVILPTPLLSIPPPINVRRCRKTGFLHVIVRPLKYQYVGENFANNWNDRAVVDVFGKARQIG